MSESTEIAAQEFRMPEGGLAPFVDGWPNVPSITVTLDGKAVMSAPLLDRRAFFDVGPYRVWVNK